MMDLLKAFERMERSIPRLLAESSLWRGREMRFENREGALTVDRVERVWEEPWDASDVEVPDYARGMHAFVRLHRFSTTRAGEEIMHHHRWPGAFRIVSGGYRVAFGRSDTAAGWPGPAREIEVDLRAPSAYAMEHVDVWHSLRVEETTRTLVLALPDWPGANRPNPPNEMKARLMTDVEVEETLAIYREHYPVVNV